MGKDARRRRREQGKQIPVTDAQRLIAAAEEMAHRASIPGVPPSHRYVGDAASAALKTWHHSRVVLRIDPDLIQALLSTPRDTELLPDWLSRFPFGSVAMSLPQPMPIDDGERVCNYLGFLACGIRTRMIPDAPPGALPPPAVNPEIRSDPAWTSYGDISGGDGVRFLWLFEDQGRIGAQTITAFFRFDHSDKVERGRTIQELIDRVTVAYREIGGTPGEDVAVLVPISLLLLFYLSTHEPDLDELAPGSFPRPAQLSDAQVMNVGWRVGSAIRRYRAEAGEPTGTGGPSGWRLPPHIRSAHVQRFRIATRDEHGQIIGNVHGVQHVDWHYEERWIPPTPVNVGDGGPDPVVRPVTL